ncbi:MAG: tRNA glutamyl-Q(34) synthetase GluQRS, partial [Alphaproteobacteria bacterium]
RFAPSPTGHLHLGHAYSALLNQKMAREQGGRMLLRMEDIDRERCTHALERSMLDDLRWIGLAWEQPIRRQSEHFGHYKETLERLIRMDLVYPAFLSRSEIGRELAKGENDPGRWPRDPDGAPLYPPTERQLSSRERRERIAAGRPHAWRLNMERALDHAGTSLSWYETGSGRGRRIAAQPQDWGDIVVARRDTPTSYHLSVVMDDALQGVTHVVRGKDLFQATSVHRLLQHILGIDPPSYHHHRLILDDAGEKLSKSRGDTALTALRQQGRTRQEIYDSMGL